MSININPWGDSVENVGSIGYILDNCERTTHTGTFTGGSTVSIDTELGANVKYLVIIDESATAFPSKNEKAIEGVYLLTYDTEQSLGVTVFSMTAGAPIVSNTRFDKTMFNRAKSISFENGVFNYEPNYDNNELYNNFTPNHTYRWFAW